MKIGYMRSARAKQRLRPFRVRLVDEQVGSFERRAVHVVDSVFLENARVPIDEAVLVYEAEVRRGRYRPVA